ncbi:hypothetical protein Hanom_Chr05g00423291 [Helianthus anomalus]
MSTTRRFNCSRKSSRYRLFVISHLTEIDKVEEHISDNGALWTTNESENENEQGCSMEEYTIRPVDTTKSYRRRTARAVENIETEEDPNDNENIDDMMDFSFDLQEMSQLNLVMGVGTQT